MLLCNQGFTSLDSFLDWELLCIGSSQNSTLHSCAIWGKLLNLSTTSLLYLLNEANNVLQTQLSSAISSSKSSLVSHLDQVPFLCAPLCSTPHKLLLLNCHIILRLSACISYQVYKDKALRAQHTVCHLINCGRTTL